MIYFGIFRPEACLARLTFGQSKVQKKENDMSRFNRKGDEDQDDGAAQEQGNAGSDPGDHSNDNTGVPTDD